MDWSGNQSLEMTAWFLSWKIAGEVCMSYPIHKKIFILNQRLIRALSAVLILLLINRLQATGRTFDQDYSENLQTKQRTEFTKEELKAKTLFDKSMDMDEQGIGSLKEKLQLRQKVAELAPETWFGHFSKAWLAGQNNDLEQEEQELLIVIEMKPDFAEAYDNLGIVYFNTERRGKAVESFRKAIELNSKLVFTWNNLGVVWMSDGWMQEAMVHFRKSSELRPGYGEPLINIASILQRLGNYGLAICYARAGLSSMPDSPKILFFLGRLYSEAGNIVHARLLLKQSLVLNEMQGDARELLTEIAQSTNFGFRIKTDEDYSSFKKKSPG